LPDNATYLSPQPAIENDITLFIATCIFRRNIEDRQKSGCVGLLTLTRRHKEY